MSLKSDKILDSKEAIKDYIGNVSDYRFTQYIEAGMPARYERGRGWIAHADNIDEFFRLYTRISMKNNVHQLVEEEQF